MRPNYAGTARDKGLLWALVQLGGARSKRIVLGFFAKEELHHGCTLVTMSAAGALLIKDAPAPEAQSTLDPLLDRRTLEVSPYAP